jgi:hypothetical protein
MMRACAPVSGVAASLLIVLAPKRARHLSLQTIRRRLKKRLKKRLGVCG